MKLDLKDQVIVYVYSIVKLNFFFDPLEWSTFDLQYIFIREYLLSLGLVFVVYPQAIALMSGSVFWSIIFFLMLITLGLDSTFGGLEAMITALCDEYPRAIGRRREWFVLFLLIGIYLCALPTMTYVSITSHIKLVF